MTWAAILALGVPDDQKVKVSMDKSARLSADRGEHCAPLLLALVGGVLELSFFFYQEQLITVGVRDAAR